MRYVTKHTYITECEPGDHSHVPGDHSRVTRRTYATACEYIYRARAHSLTGSELSTGWSVWKRTDVHLHESGRRPVVSNAGCGADIRFISAIR